MQVNKTSIPGAANTPKNYLAADHPFKEEKMKVTLLIATCTLVVLLQQMQAPMAKPLDLEPPVELNDICELILPFHSIEYMMVGTYQNYFYRIHGYMKFLLLSFNYVVIIITPILPVFSSSQMLLWHYMWWTTTNCI